MKHFIKFTMGKKVLGTLTKVPAKSVAHLYAEPTATCALEAMFYTLFTRNVMQRKYRESCLCVGVCGCCTCTHLFLLVSAVEAGKSDGKLKVIRLAKPVDVKESSPAMVLWKYNAKVREALLDLYGPESDGDGDDHLFSESNFAYAAVATPDNIKAFKNTGPRAPLFPFGNTQNAMFEFFLRAVQARRKVEFSVLRTPPAAVSAADSDEETGTQAVAGKRKRDKTPE